MLLSKTWLWKAAVIVPAAAMAWGGTFGKVVAIGGQPADIALDEGRGVLYVANFTANRVEVMSLADNTIQTSINVAPQPSSIALSPDGRFLVVTHFGNFAAPAPPSNALTVVDLTTNGKQTFALGNPPVGVAFGIDDRALVVTTTDYLLFDPLLGTTQQLDTIAGVVAKTLPVAPANFPPNITAASMATSTDGLTIYGMGGSTSTFTFRYDVNTKTVYPGGIVVASGLFGPRVVSVNHDASLVIAGWTMINRRGNFTHLLTSTNQFNIGTTAFDDGRGLVYAQMPQATNTSPVLQILDVDNFAVLEQLQLPENTTGKSLLSSDGNTLYSMSDSGVLVLPVGSVSSFPRLAATQPDVVFNGSFCDRRIASQDLTIVDPGGGNTPFSISSQTSGVSVSPSSGVTPLRVRVSVDPTVFANQQGTVAGTLQLTSARAVNVTNNVRVLVNTRQPDQRGTIVNVPGNLSDLLADPTRNRFYILRQDTNKLLVFDANNYTQIATLKTGNVPKGMAITFDRRYLLIANDRSQLVTVIDLDTLQPSDPIYIQNFTAHSIAASANAILAATVDYQGKGRIVKLDMASRTGVQLPSLGIFTNDINPSSVVVASPNGSAIMLAEPDGNLLLYNANSDSFTVSRQDFKTLSGAYAASSFDQYVVGNNLLNASLVPMMQFESGTGTASGFAFVDQFGFRTTVPVPAATPASTGTGPSATPASTQNAAFSSVAGVIQRLDLSSPTPSGSVSKATRMTEAPLLSTTTTPFTRTLAPLYSRNAIVNLTVSGFTVLPWNYDASVAPPKIQKVVNAADGASAVAPGGLISIYGQQFSPVNMATKEIPVPTALADSCLTVNGMPVPMLFVSPNQINAQMPFEAVGNVTMILRTPGGVSDNYNTVVLPGAPSVFRASVPGMDSAVPTIVRDKNSELVTPSNPVHKNDVVVVYLTGLGATFPSVDTGVPGPSDPLASAMITPKVTMGDVSLPLIYAGLAPGEVGVYQINVKVPPNVPTGLSVPFSITQGGFSTSVPVRVVD